MILKCTNVILTAALLAGLAGCTSSSSSGDGSSSVTEVSISAAPAASLTRPVTVSANEKTFKNSSNDATIVLTKAYLVISNATIETSCGASFSAALDGLLNIVMPQAYAHTSATPTSTGEPYVINLMAADNAAIAIGSMSPSVADYCGVDVDLFAADADAYNLPVVVAGEPDMVGKTLYIEGSYTPDGGATGIIKIDTGATLINRELMLGALMMITAASPTATISLGINYDTWFDSVDLTALESEAAAKAGDNYNQVLQNITDSIHQL
jgi:hypothetical protein